MQRFVTIVRQVYMRLTFLILIFSIFSCKKDSVSHIDCGTKSNDMEIVKKSISGTYTWAYTRVSMRGSAPYIETPITTGKPYKYVFKKNGTVDYYENNALKSSDNYVVDYEFKVSLYPSDSATMIIITDRQTSVRKEYFRPWLCSDSARFFNPYNSIDYQRYFKRN